MAYRNITKQELRRMVLDTLRETGMLQHYMREIPKSERWYKG